MWKILGLSLAVIAAPAAAQDRYVFNQNQTGLALPGVNLPQGYDEVRTSDGTSCRSSNTGDGAYADVGVIGGNGEQGKLDAGAVYGRVVVPLGARGTRLDCRRLYDLEIERLKAEVRLLKAGVGQRGGGAEDVAAFEQGWSNTMPQTTGSVRSASADTTGSEQQAGVVVAGPADVKPTNVPRSPVVRKLRSKPVPQPPVAPALVDALRTALP